MSWLTLLATVAEGGDENTGLIFYIGGGVLAAFAVLVGVVGVMRPVGEGAARGIMGVGVILAAAAMTTAIVGAG